MQAAFPQAQPEIGIGSKYPALQRIGKPEMEPVRGQSPALRNHQQGYRAELNKKTSARRFRPRHKTIRRPCATGSCAPAFKPELK